MKKQILTTVAVGSLVFANGISVNATEIDQTNEQVTIVDSNNVDVENPYYIDLGYLSDLSGEDPISGDGWTFENNTLTFDANANGKEYTISGTSTDINIVVPEGVNTHIILSDASITSEESPIAIASGASLSLTIEGINTVTSTNGTNAAINVSKGAALTIDGSGSLTASSFVDESAPGSAGIGGNTNEGTGTISIIGGTVEAHGGTGSAGIGGAYDGEAGSIFISGDAEVTAYGGKNGAGIGSGHYDPEGKVVENVDGTIEITGDAEVTAYGGNNGAGLGGGHNNSGGEITISGNATINATGGLYGAGIGGGNPNGVGEADNVEL